MIMLKITTFLEVIRMLRSQSNQQPEIEGNSILRRKRVMSTGSPFVEHRVKTVSPREYEEIKLKFLMKC